jgi:hypothetical protein
MGVKMGVKMNVKKKMSAKKKPTGRRSTKGEVQAPGVEVQASSNPQSAADRRAAEAELRALIAKFAPAESRLIGVVRSWLLKRIPTAHELVYEYRDCFVISFSPSGHGYEGVFAVRGDASGVKLYFNRGRELPDPAKVLQGSGNQVRLVVVEGAATLARPEIMRLVDEAIAHNRVPFARAGRGSMIVKLTSAKKRQQR